MAGHAPTIAAGRKRVTWTGIIMERFMRQRGQRQVRHIDRGRSMADAAHQTALCSD